MPLRETTSRHQIDIRALLVSNVEVARRDGKPWPDGDVEVAKRDVGVERIGDGARNLPLQLALA